MALIDTLNEYQTVQTEDDETAVLLLHNRDVVYILQNLIAITPMLNTNVNKEVNAKKT